MASRRCSMCAISYPQSFAHNNCKVCGEPTDPIYNDEPTEDWESIVAVRLRDREEAERIVEAVPGPKERHDVLIYEEHGLFWANDWHLRASGINPPSERKMWLFRACGHVWETQGWDEKRRRWWVEEVCTIASL